MPTIYDAIKNDHDAHRDLLATIADGSKTKAARKKAWEDFYHDVKAHAAAEEETFYSKLISKTWGQDTARHSVHEHQQLDDLMEDLNKTAIDADGWLDKFNTLHHDYNHHIDEEEDEVFTRARDVISTDELEGYGSRFLKRKEEEAGLIDKKKADKLED
ncbi:hemerythrin domain-containing protein [Pseudorhodobacter ferrugineus]|uniref:hemerythrin domain-containing protein n=1 Tax=Pseudorhodobacter ferrugineus TaxID=77008 RepID=UPI0003B4F218|nr:hemerythrin domain-containing protein [Pseudorhodobacter ferrugineus]